jgi:hypothetical protein
MHRFRLITFVAASGLACGGRPPQAAAPAPAPVLDARCIALNDSVFATLPPEVLPNAKLHGEPPRIPPPISAAQRHTPVTFTYLVRPDGVSDTSTVSITGTENKRFRDLVVRYARRNQMAPAESDGCPVWSKVSVTMTPLGIERVRRGP